MKRIFIALIAVLIAAIIRKYFLESLENKVVWITFYPAIMVAAIMGGFYIGILSAFLSLFIAVFEWHHFTYVPFIQNDSDWISVFVFMLNCTLVSGIAEYSRLQRNKAQKAQKQAELANKTKSIFLANMSHELRTPLNAILGFTQIMQQNKYYLEADYKNLDIINRSGQHLLNLINNVLDISKIEAGQLTAEIMPFNLKNMLYDVIVIMRQRAEYKGLFFRTDFQSDLPVYVLSDELKIKQILINLLSNAIKFTNQGSITCSIQFSPSKNTLHILVQDTGVGISINDISRIFEPFVQVGNTSTNKGTGLGLTISRQYAELLGGTLEAESKLGVGSVFTVKIPMKPALSSDVSTNNYAGVKTLAPDSPKPRILVAEDQAENWILLERILENIGCTVKVVENGKDAVDIFETFAPDLIFMDIRMPVMDGMEATLAIRKTVAGKNVKIVGVSAHVFKDEIKQFQLSGMDFFISKPYHFSQIYECLANLLQVKYTYVSDEAPPINFEEKKILTPQLLSELDIHLLTELKNSVQNLDSDALKELVVRISSQSPELSSILNSYIEEYRTTEIFRTLNEILTN